MRTLATMIILLCSSNALATPSRIAVLEFRNPAGLTEQEVVYITELARAAALRLPASRFFVMTRENILEQLPPGTSIDECVGECEVETGRNVGADYVMTGEVIRFGGSLRVLMKLHDTKTSRLLGNERASGPRVDALEEPVEHAAGRLFGKLGRRGSRATSDESTGAIGEKREAWDPGSGGQVLVRFASEPSGAVVLVDGQVACRDTRKDCASNLAAGPHEVSMQLEHHLPRVEQMTAVAGLELRWRLTPNFALLTVESVPSGLEVMVDERPSGRTPVREHRVQAGVRAVLVKSRCHYDTGERVRLERGETRRLMFTLDAREAAIDVTATTRDGRAVEAEVRVDGAVVGRSPGRFKVPVCAKKVEVVGEAGQWSGDLALEERKVQPVSAQLGASGGLDWVRIGGGAFRMGTNVNKREKPVRRVRVGTFQMSRSEVTVGQYGACVKAGQCTAPRAGRSCNWKKAGREQHPVNCVDWGQASAFAKWAGGRLPSEAEWEYAARSGGKARKYPWGNEEASCARVVMKGGGRGCGPESTWPVCSKAKGHTEQGLCDMAGNVWEWVADWYGPYGEAPTDGSARTRAAQGRVNRGGGWNDTAGFLRAALRDGDLPGFLNGNLGFRVAKSGP